MGRAGWAASVTALSPAGLWRAAARPAPRDPARWARRLRPARLRSPCATRRAREAMLATFAAHPERIPAAAGRELVLGWIDAERLRRRQPGDAHPRLRPGGYPEDVPVTIAWGELDRLVGPPKPERRPAGARFLVLPGVGHTPTWDDPELVARTLLEGSSVSAAAEFWESSGHRATGGGAT